MQHLRGQNGEKFGSGHEGEQAVQSLDKALERPNLPDWGANS